MRSINHQFSRLLSSLMSSASLLRAVHLFVLQLVQHGSLIFRSFQPSSLSSDIRINFRSTLTRVLLFGLFKTNEWTQMQLTLNSIINIHIHKGEGTTGLLQVLQINTMVWRLTQFNRSEIGGCHSTISN